VEQHGESPRRTARALDRADEIKMPVGQDCATVDLLGRVLRGGKTSVVEVTAAGMIAMPGLRDRISALGPWFHNMELAGIATAPEHSLAIIRPSNGMASRMRCPSTCTAARCSALAAMPAISVSK
jgi:hypothetical protein